MLLVLRYVVLLPVSFYLGRRLMFMETDTSINTLRRMQMDKRVLHARELESNTTTSELREE